MDDGKNMRRAERYQKSKRHHARAAERGKPSRQTKREAAAAAPPPPPAAGGGRRGERARVAYDTYERAPLLPGTAEAAEATEQHDGPLAVTERPPFKGVAAIEVVEQTTLAACRRLARDRDVAALNFASARNPGGGWLKGSGAQEESLCRASALYFCIVGAPMYEANNRNPRANLYRNAALFSPNVPVFKDDDGNAVPPYTVSVITCPAPNAGRAHVVPEVVARELHERLRLVLAVAATHGCRTVVLGAFGCGVFGNDPATVAGGFAELLQTEFKGHFERVVFAIPDPRVADVFRAALP